MRLFLLSLGSYFYFKLCVRFSVLVTLYFWLVVYDVVFKNFVLFDFYVLVLSVLGCILSIIIGMNAVDDVENHLDGT